MRTVQQTITYSCDCCGCLNAKGPYQNVELRFRDSWNYDNPDFNEPDRIVMGDLCSTCIKQPLAFLLENLKTVYAR